jgi:hypothetical protein
VAVVGNSQHAKHRMRSQDVGGEVARRVYSAADQMKSEATRGKSLVWVLCFKQGPKDQNASQSQSRQRGLVAPSPHTCIDARHLERSSFPKDLHQFLNVAYEPREKNLIEIKRMQSVGTRYEVHGENGKVGYLSQH